MNTSVERRIDLAILLAYILLSLGMCYPMSTRMTTDVAGRHMDTRVFQWNDWWVKKALLNGLNLNYTDDIYYPSKTSLVGHNFNWVSSFLSIPLSLLFGPTVAYNLTFLLTIFLSGYGAYLLVRYLTERRDAAFVAGVVFAFFPYHLSGNWSGQMNLANVQWLPLFALFLLRTIQAWRIRDAIWAGIFAALASLDCWFFAIFMAMWSPVYLAFSVVAQRERWGWRLVGLLCLAGVVAGALIAPFAWPVLTDPDGGAVSQGLKYYEDDKATDLLAFFTPSSDHPLLGPQVESTYKQFSHWRPAYLGYVPLALALYAAVGAHRHKSIPWFVSGFLFAALALGTVLRVKGVTYPGVPMPYRILIELLPALAIIRQASRFSVMVGLSLSVLTGLGCADLLTRIRHARFWSRAAVPVLCTLILFEYLAIPCPLLSSQVPAFYTDLAQEAGDFAIVELPLEDFYSRRSLFPQTVHGKKLVNGYLARASYQAGAFVYTSPLLKALHFRIAVDPTLVDVPRALDVLARNDIRYIVIHKTPMPPHPAVETPVLASWRELFGPSPHFEDGEILVYRVPRQPAPSAAPVPLLSNALGLEAIESRRTRIVDQQFLTVDLTWQALADLEQGYDCSLALLGPNGQVAATGPWTISPHYPTSRWQAGVHVSERYALTLAPSLPGGAYTLAVRVTDATGQEARSIAYPVEVSDEAPSFAPVLEDIQFPADITFGDSMWLLGYSQRLDGDRLAIKMAWQVLRTMGTNYKVFVHLIHPDDGTIVAQQDAMPRGWSYPTSYWSRQEVFVDRLDLEVKGVAPGEYLLAMGLYRPETGRLAATDGSGNRVPEDRVFLSERVVIR